VGNIPDTAVEEGTADGDEDAGGDKLIASDVDPDYEKSDSKDDEEIPDEEEAAEEIADEVVEAANGDEDAGGDKYIASDDVLIMRSPRVRMKRRLMRKRHLRCEYLIRHMSNCFVQILCYHLTSAKL
jgi:hypothetical protein